MPTYEYSCKKCGKKFEQFQKISDAPIEKCSNCGGKVSRLISAAAFSLKGGGWYKDGYSKTKGTTREKKDGKKDKSQK